MITKFNTNIPQGNSGEGGKSSSIIIPVLIIGGIALAWYLYSRSNDNKNKINQEDND
jgi:hypothetical protein